jgi:hypothetical protein
MTAGSRLAAWRHDLVAAGLCIALGALLATLPHLLWWPRLGEPVWLADNDDLLYLSFAGQSYDNHPWYLADPLRASGGTTIYPWLQLSPAVLLARALGVPPLSINVLWRLWAGVSIAIGWYVVLRQFVARPVIAAGLTAVLLGDVGMLANQLVVRHASAIAQLASGDTTLLSGHPQIHVQWRIISPGLSLASLLLHVALLARARRAPTRARIVASGAAFGLLVGVYFYYWTTAAVALAAAALVDRGHRGVYVHTAWIGLLVGSPAIVSGFLLKQAASLEALNRFDKFLPVARFSELLIPKIAIGLLVVGGVWVWRRRRDLLYLWLLGASGVLLANQHVITGLQMENDHWHFARGPSVSLLVVLLVAPALAAAIARRRAIRVACAIVLVAHVAGAIALRAVEATGTVESVALTTAYERYRAQRLTAGAPPLAANGVVGGDGAFVDLAAVAENQRPVDHYAAVVDPLLDNREWDMRVALNAFIAGQDRAAFEAAQTSWAASARWGPWARNAALRGERVARRLGAYDAVAGNPDAALDRFAVSYVAIPARQAPPSYLRTRWTRVQDGPYWQLWARNGARARS